MFISFRNNEWRENGWGLSVKNLEQEDFLPFVKVVFKDEVDEVLITKKSIGVWGKSSLLESTSFNVKSILRIIDKWEKK